MTRPWLIVAIGGFSIGVAACGDYDGKNAAYNEKNAAYDEGNAAYDAAGNETYNVSGGNAAYTPPPDANASYNNLVGVAPPDNAITNRY